MSVLAQHNIASPSWEKEYSSKVSLEHRKKYAQFFTPLTIANLMAKWLLGNRNLKKVLEPAFGLGIFSRALLQERSDISIRGFEIDETILNEANAIFSDTESVQISLKDYIYNDWGSLYDGIICNPPYFKFHDYDNKSFIKEIENRLNVKLNGFTNLYSLFLLKSIHQLKPNGRVAYIVPSEFLNADYGKLVKAALIKTKILRHVIVINFKENVFEDALTTACILLCSNDRNSDRVKFTSISKLNELGEIVDFIDQYPRKTGTAHSEALVKLDPNVKWRKYYERQNALAFSNLVPFASVAKVVRGIATGANEYFTFSKAKAIAHKIDKCLLLPCICKAGDVKTSFFTPEDYGRLADNDRPAYLFNGQASDDRNIKKYIISGEREGIDKKYLTSCRTPWYALEKRPPAPIWVTVFNRSGLKFIRNEANVSNLTTFHCIYPLQSGLFPSVNIDLLFAYLLTDTAKQLFKDNSREYGNGLQKFEPNDLNKGMMLNLALLNPEVEEVVIRTYRKYRDSVLDFNPDEHLVTEINDILISEYARGEDF